MHALEQNSSRVYCFTAIFANFNGWAFDDSDSVTVFSYRWYDETS